WILITEANDVQISYDENHVILDSCIVNVTLSNPHGRVVGIQYGGLDNLLDTGKDETRRGYILQRGSSGFYAYAIYERRSGYPACDLGQTRMVFRLKTDEFQQMAINEEKQREMPNEEDRGHGRSVPLRYPEAVVLTNPTDPRLKGQVDDKYQYSMDTKDVEVYGWVSSDPKVGFWIIFPSQEFRTGGPTKQELTLHAGPICLVMFHSGHYMGNNYCEFHNGEAWRKVFGPFRVHLNSAPKSVQPSVLWKAAKQQSLIETNQWPYSFPISPYFLKKAQRCSVSGRLLVHDRFISPKAFPANSAYIGLAAPGDKGSWQKESKVNQNGVFPITNILPGEYNIYGWVQNIVGDYKNETLLKLSPGSSIDLGDLVYEPPRNGPTILEIGVPDRTAAEFYIPDANPKYINELFLNSEKYRQYGLWERYADLYPDGDLVYTVGISDHSKDWFFAHVTRAKLGGTYEATTRQIKFKLGNSFQNGTYTLCIAIASATHSHLSVQFNDKLGRPQFEASLNEQDNAIARHGIHGFYQFLNVQVNPNWLVDGDNTLFITQKTNINPFVVNHCSDITVAAGDKRLSGTMELMSEGGLKERIIRAGKKLKHPHHSEDALLKDLEETTNCLAMVKQSNKYMIHSLMFKLIKPKIFWHEDVRVEIMVVTYIVEATRVTTPNVPYSDDIMRDIFKHMDASRDLVSMCGREKESKASHEGKCWNENFVAMDKEAAPKGISYFVPPCL
ncbi:hypothetical protein KI387_019645, partial [Taxus chinensis]